MIIEKKERGSNLHTLLSVMWKAGDQVDGGGGREIFGCKGHLDIILIEGV